MKIPYLLYTVCALLAVTGQVAAQNIIVGWGGDSVSTTTPLNGWSTQTVFGNNGTYNANSNGTPPPSRVGRLGAANVDAILTDGIVGRAFSTTTQFSPTSGYTGQRFYGGASANLITPGVTVPTIDDLQIRNSGTDSLDFRFQLSSKLHDSRIAVYFDKQDFLAGANSPSAFVQIGPSSTLGIVMGNSSSQQVNTDGELRWIVREAGQFWISAANAQGDPNVKSKDGGGANGSTLQNGNTLTSSAALGELRYWAPWDPTPGAGLNFNFEPVYTSRFVIANPLTVFTRDLTTNPFTNIDGLGFYIEGDQFETNVFQLEIASINFSVLVVPEPGTIALLGLTGFFGLQWYLRRKNATAKKTIETGQSNETEPVVANVPA